MTIVLFNACIAAMLIVQNLSVVTATGVHVESIPVKHRSPVERLLKGLGKPFKRRGNKTRIYCISEECVQQVKNSQYVFGPITTLDYTQVRMVQTSSGRIPMVSVKAVGTGADTQMFTMVFDTSRSYSTQNYGFGLNARGTLVVRQETAALSDSDKLNDIEESDTILSTNDYLSKPFVLSMQGSMAPGDRQMEWVERVLVKSSLEKIAESGVLSAGPKSALMKSVGQLFLVIDRSSAELYVGKRSTMNFDYHYVTINPSSDGWEFDLDDCIGGPAVVKCTIKIDTGSFDFIRISKSMNNAIRSSPTTVADDSIGLPPTSSFVLNLANNINTVVNNENVSVVLEETNTVTLSMSFLIQQKLSLHFDYINQRIGFANPFDL